MHIIKNIYKSLERLKYDLIHQKYIKKLYFIIACISRNLSYFCYQISWLSFLSSKLILTCSCSDSLVGLVFHSLVVGVAGLVTLALLHHIHVVLANVDLSFVLCQTVEQLCVEARAGVFLLLLVLSGLL